MISRLVLVGMVAALGITIPTRKEIQGWVNAAHSWTASRLAALDRSAAHGDEPIAIVLAQEPPRPSFTPLVPGEANSIVDEMNLIAQGLDLPPGTRVVSRRVAVAGESRWPARPEWEGGVVAPAIDVVEWKLMAEVIEAARRSSEGAGAEDCRARSTRSRARKPSSDCAFTRSQTAPTRERVAFSPAGTGSRSGESRPAKLDLIEPLEGGPSDIAGALNRSAEGIALPPLLPTTAKANGPAIEPMDPADTLRPTLADELNRVSEGLSLAPTWSSRAGAAQGLPSPSSHSSAPPAAMSTRRPSPDGATPEVSQALRLTRDAFHAWVMVLSGPTPVQVSSR